MRFPLGGITAVIALSQIPSVNAADIQIFRPGAASIPAAAPARCRLALTAKISCSFNLLRAVNGGITSWTKEQLDGLCSPACKTSLTNYVNNVHAQCPANTPLNGAEGVDLYTYPDENMWRFNVTCQESAKGEYCQTILAAEKSECDACWFSTNQLLLNSPFGQPWFGTPETFASAKKECKIADKDYPITYTAGAPPATTTGGAGPTEVPTKPEPVLRCDPADAKVTVGAKDTCPSISKANSVSTDELVSINGLDAACQYLKAGQKLCMPQPCKIYEVKANDTCKSIIKESGGTFKVTQLVSWNTGINNGCTNLNRKIGFQICVSPPGTKEAPKNEPPKAVPKPSNAFKGSVDKCATWYTLDVGNSCQYVTQTYRISQADFVFLNKGVRSDCTNLVAGTAYCVQPVGDVRTYPDWQPIPVPTDILTDTIDLSKTAIVNATKSYFWPNATTTKPLPTITATNRPQPSNWSNYTMCPDFAKETPDFSNGLPAYAVENDDWMDVYSSYCLLDPGQPLPTKPPVWPPLDVPLRAVPAPAPTNKGAPTDCLKWHVIKDGDSCDVVLKKYSLTLAKFREMNPWVDAKCSNIWKDTAYCLDVISNHDTTIVESTQEPTSPPNTTKPPVTSGPIVTSKPPPNTTEGTSNVTSKPGTPVTVAPPGPTDAGTSKKCEKWHIFKQGETCTRMLLGEGIKLPAFRQLNTAVSEKCDNLKVGNAYCVKGQ